MGEYELFQFFTCAYLQQRYGCTACCQGFLKLCHSMILTFLWVSATWLRHLYYRNAAAKMLWGLNTGYKQVDQTNIGLFLTSSNRILHERWRRGLVIYPDLGVLMNFDDTSIWTGREDCVKLVVLWNWVNIQNCIAKLQYVSWLFGWASTFCVTALFRLCVSTRHYMLFIII